jgi:hypothetical protein
LPIAGSRGEGWLKNYREHAANRMSIPVSLLYAAYSDYPFGGGSDPPLGGCCNSPS